MKKIKKFNLDKLTWNKYLSKFEDFSYFQSFEYGEYFNEIGWKVSRVIVEEDNKIRLLAQIFFKKRFGVFILWIPGGPIGDLTTNEKITSQELGSSWIKHSVEDKPLGKTNIKNHSGRSNEANEQSNYRGIGLAEMINSIENNRKHRCNGNLALHVLDIIECAMISSIYKVEVDLRSTCERPMPFNDDEIQKLLK